MTIGKTIKSLRASGKRNTSPVKRADGGATQAPAWGHKVRTPLGDPGRISADSEKQAKKIDADAPRSIGNLNALGTGVLGTAAYKFLTSKVLPNPVKGIGGVLSGAGAIKTGKNLVGDMQDASKSIKQSMDLRDGKVEEGYEDRKSGGRVRKPSK